MAVNKIVMNTTDGEQTLIDLTGDDISPETAFDGVTFHGADGNTKTGTFTLAAEMSEQGNLIAQIRSALAGKVAGGGTETDPKEQYQRVEYIESDGESYILTDVVADNSYGLEIIAAFPTLIDQVPMGSRVDGNATRFYCAYPLSASSCYFGFNNGSAISCALTVDTVYRLQTNFMNSRLVNIFDANGIRKGGTSISATLTQQTCPVAIFGYMRADTAVMSTKRQYTLYSARCSRGHEVVREYIPCYRKSDGVIGLYEKFTGEFLTNVGTGAFAKGTDIEW